VAPFLLAWKDPGSETIQKSLITNNHSFAIIPPGVNHAVKNTGNQVVYLIAFRSPAGLSQEPEVLPAILIE
jgi:mannose-6-phosphate isomerase-like protein (cupin superfamily)